LRLTVRIIGHKEFTYVFATAENMEQSLNFHEEDRRTENFLIALHEQQRTLYIVAAESRIRVFDIQRLLRSTRSDMNCL